MNIWMVISGTRGANRACGSIVSAVYKEHCVGHKRPVSRQLQMAKIAFYEDRDFRGKSYDCKGDSADLQGFIRRCNSVKVDGGWWVLYERDNYSGYQYVVGPGEYSDYRRWMGFNDCVRSCRTIRNAQGLYKLKLFDRPNFAGQSWELTENTKSIQEKWVRQEVQSCKVLEGSWIFFEHPNFCGRQYLLEKGEYRHHSEWGAAKPTVGSARIILEL